MGELPGSGRRLVEETANLPAGADSRTDALSIAWRARFRDPVADSLCLMLFSGVGSLHAEKRILRACISVKPRQTRV